MVMLKTWQRLQVIVLKTEEKRRAEFVFMNMCCNINMQLDLFYKKKEMQ